MNYKTRIFVSATFITLAFIFIVVALWGPRIERNVDIMDLMFVLDITQSMNVQDVEVEGQAAERLEWAKEYTHETLQHLPCGTHAGLSIFSESRSLILINPVEVCKNYNDLIQMLVRIDGTMAWANSSEVSKAVFTAIKQAELIEPSPSIVFISDGHEAPPLNKTLFPKFRGEPGEIKGIFIGVGGDDLISIPKRDETGEIIGVWGVNEVLHQDVYVTGRGDLQAQKERSARTEHMSSQKKDHLEGLANMVAFDYVASPDNSKDIIKRLQKTADTRHQLVKEDISTLLAGSALLFLSLVYLPFQFGRQP